MLIIYLKQLFSWDYNMTGRWVVNIFLNYYYYGQIYNSMADKKL